MIIECPACHTRYRTDGSLSITDSTLFECSREQCGHVFSYFPESPRETGADSPPGKPFVDPPDAQDAEPYLTVDDDFSPSPPPSLVRTSDEPAAVLSSSRPASPTKASVSTPQMTKSFTDDFTDPEDFSLEPPSLSSLAPPAPPSVTNEEVRRNEPRRRATPPHQRPRPTPLTVVSVWPVLGFFLLLVLGYYLLGNRWRTNIIDTESMLARLPLVGSSFVASQYSPQNITLSEVKSGFWVTKDSKRVFAISGKATNNAAVPASLIQIEGQLHNIDGETIDQRIISCGMGTTAESLPTLTTREISVLQGLVPPKQFHVPPGQSVNFLIVFPNPPPAIAELSCRVATAQFGAS